MQIIAPILLILVLLAGAPIEAHAAAPAVKKSRNGICHPIGGTYYHKTKNYTPYDSMKACIASGGRPPKR